MIYLNKKISLILVRKLWEKGIKEMPKPIYGTYWYGNEVKKEVTDLPAYCMEDLITPSLCKDMATLTEKTEEDAINLFAETYYFNGWKGINRLMVNLLDIDVKYCWTCKNQNISLTQLTGSCLKINKEIPPHIIDKGCEFWEKR